MRFIIGVWIRYMAVLMFLMKRNASLYGILSKRRIVINPKKDNTGIAKPKQTTRDARFLTRKYSNRKPASLAGEQALRLNVVPYYSKSAKDAFGDIPAEVVYQPSLVKPYPKRNEPISKVVYGGNVNADRLHASLDIANCIHAYDGSLVLDAYGDASDEVKAAMEEAPSVAYHGKVPYRELLKVFETTDMLVHVEDFSEYRQLDCAHGFSTKIGDCYRSVIPFFLYGPTSIPCIQFGLDLCPEYTAASPQELKTKLEAILAGQAPYMPDENIIHDCFDAKVVGKEIAKMIGECITRNDCRD